MKNISIQSEDVTYFAPENKLQSTQQTNKLKY